MIGTGLRAGWPVQFDILVVFGRQLGKHTCQNRRTYPLIYPGTRLSLRTLVKACTSSGSGETNQNEEVVSISSFYSAVSVMHITRRMFGAVDNSPVTKDPEITFWEMLFPCPAVPRDFIRHFASVYREMIDGYRLS